ncbi:hypothetical protein Hypma_006414 [Hypsizygus marmoreus]|uniref:Uncharacterized protein n=1 Tax=Hypsizygus marmoreus TaxID=39966 RepID=A0A369K1Q0_HYPMA|nr:hypothetical protein Hypma_006414 [Hypsizygus marmoreus]
MIFGGWRNYKYTASRSQPQLVSLPAHTIYRCRSPDPFNSTLLPLLDVCVISKVCKSIIMYAVSAIALAVLALNAASTLAVPRPVGDILEARTELLFIRDFDLQAAYPNAKSRPEMTPTPTKDSAPEPMESLLPLKRTPPGPGAPKPDNNASVDGSESVPKTVTHTKRPQPTACKPGETPSTHKKRKPKHSIRHRRISLLDKLRHLVQVELAVQGRSVPQPVAARAPEPTPEQTSMPKPSNDGTNVTNTSTKGPAPAPTPTPPSTINNSTDDTTSKGNTGNTEGNTSTGPKDNTGLMDNTSSVDPTTSPKATPEAFSSSTRIGRNKEKTVHLWVSATKTRCYATKPAPGPSANQDTDQPTAPIAGTGPGPAGGPVTKEPAATHQPFPDVKLRPTKTAENDLLGRSRPLLTGRLHPPRRKRPGLPQEQSILSSVITVNKT